MTGPPVGTMPDGAAEESARLHAHAAFVRANVDHDRALADAAEQARIAKSGSADDLVSR